MISMINTVSVVIEVFSKYIQTNSLEGINTTQTNEQAHHLKNTIESTEISVKAQFTVTMLMELK